MDLALFVAILLLFAGWCTVHLFLCLKLFQKNKRQALLSLFVFPLAPHFAHAAKIRGLPTLWLVTGLTYFLSLIIGFI